MPESLDQLRAAEAEARLNMWVALTELGKLDGDDPTFQSEAAVVVDYTDAYREAVARRVRAQDHDALMREYNRADTGPASSHTYSDAQPPAGAAS